VARSAPPTERIAHLCKAGDCCAAKFQFIGTKATVLDCIGGDGEGNCATRQRDGRRWSDCRIQRIVLDSVSQTLFGALGPASPRGSLFPEKGDKA